MTGMNGAIPQAGTIRRYEVSGGRQGVMQYVEDGGLVVAEPTIGEGFNIMWSSDLSPRDAYQKMSPIIGLTTIRGWIQQGNNRLRECAGSKVMHDIDRDPDSVKAYHIGGSTADMSWWAQGEWDGMSDRHAILAVLLGEGAHRDLVMASMGATAISAVQEKSEELINELSVNFYGLRQA